MKFCSICGTEISIRDGENHCADCDEMEISKARRANARKARREREQALRDLGLVKVRGVLGGTYWE